jgi:hypothetical protein
MGNSVHISQKGKMRSHRKKAEQVITLVSGKYMHDFFIALTFISQGNKFTTLINFLPLFEQYVKGYNLKYFAPERFKKFIVKNETIYWGKDEDVIFPSSMFLDKIDSKNSPEEILYII